MKNTTYNKTDKQKYWYSTEIKYCVLCGSETKTRQRVYEKELSNTKFIETACYTHFI